MFFALIFAAASAGSSSAARMAMMAITTSNSISVKPERSVTRQLINLPALLPFNMHGSWDNSLTAQAVFKHPARVFRLAVFAIEFFVFM
jgi:hypothetical protein